MNIERKARQLSQQHFTEFGFNPHGGLKFQWMRACDISVHIEPSDDGEFVQGESGLWIPGGKKYERHSWGEMRGADDAPLGNCWMLAKWNSSIPEEEWWRRFGDLAPWPKHGEYTPIENWICRRDEDLERESAHAAYALRQHLGKKFNDFLDESNAKAEKNKRDERNLIGDFVDDAGTAFGNIPGSRSTGVSFPAKEAIRV